MYVTLNYTIEDSIAVVELNRPHRLNAIDPDMRRELPDALRQANEAAEVRAIMITGAGKGFCAGADLGGKPPENASAGDALQLVGGFIEVFSAIDKPMVAAVNGAAAGVGLSIALACDIRVASTASKYSAIWVRRGLVADGGASLLLPTVIGMERALELTLTGKMISAADAKEYGLVSRVVEPEELVPAAMDLCREIATQPPIAVALVKRIMLERLRRDFRESLLLETYAQHVCRGTEDHKEAVCAFVEKRDAEFVGR
ncbi:enoyl-CoA hydratase/isomerase family protein [Ottowia pentelensis]|uniref:Enoyl-CoA hydratase/isomerase family protein n=1 Tax=Ottowia pentelensis TaxID=511108 RepID=A0ABV6PUS2_9BURK